MRGFLLLVFQSAVNATHDFSRSLKRNVFNGVTQGTSSTVARGAFASYFNNGLFLHKFQGITAMFAEFVLFVAGCEIL